MVRLVYTSSNTHFGTIRENDFGKDSNKLLSNSVFGKSVESEGNEKDLLIVTKRKNKKKRGRNKHTFSIDLKNINFISED